MSERLIKRLEHGVRLDGADRDRLEALVAQSFLVEPDEDIVSEGHHAPAGHIVLEGLAASYKLLADGSRQIFHFMLPGDTCDMNRQVMGWRDNSIAAFVQSRVVRVSSEEVNEIARVHPNLAHAFWWALLCDQAMLRERLVSVGRRTADRRLAHLFCELALRNRAVGLIETDSSGRDTFPFPVTQPELADAVGLTAVHVNRTLQQLRDMELVAFRSRRVTILDQPRLAALAGFDGRYLQLD